MLAPLKKANVAPGEIVERWQLNLPPEGVIILLQATCIDRTDARRTADTVWNTLWGPKSWSIYFNGWHFRLEPLQNRSRELSGEPSYEWMGEIAPTKEGSVVEVRVRTSGGFARLEQNRWIAVGLALASAIFSIPMVAGKGVAAMIGVPLLVFTWTLLAVRWTGTPWVAMESFQFLDQVFASHLVSKLKA